MSETFDPNKAVAETVKSLVESATSKVWNEGKGVAKSLYLDGKVMATSHTKYIARVSKDFYKSKSFLNNKTKTPLTDFYIPLGIERGETRYSEATISNLTAVENFNVITGGGGSGKSMMMRYLFLDTLKEKQKVPVFVELRDLNDSSSSLITRIGETLFQNGFTRDEEFYRRAMRAGHFAIFLDGFDETDDKERIAKEIQQLGKEFNDNFITVSSRPDDTFSGWSQFNVWTIAPLTLEQASELVEKVPKHIFDPKTKTRFLSDLKTKLFESHRSFLSNPLLLSIMVLTYKDAVDIPKKLSLYYEQAFTTLFQRHDALKGGYKRKRLCPHLDIQDFARIFSAFSILTYGKSKHSFTEKEALEFLTKAKKLVNVTFDERDFLEDAIQAVSLLIREGLTITFAHRSFQEYFTAEYIRELSADKSRPLIKKYVSHVTEAVVRLLHDIAPEMVESVFIIPELHELGKLISYNGTITEDNYRSFLKLYLTDFNLEAGLDESKAFMFFPRWTSNGGFFYAFFAFLRDTYLSNELLEKYILFETMIRFTNLAEKVLSEQEGVNLGDIFSESQDDMQPDEFLPRGRSSNREVYVLSINKIIGTPALFKFLKNDYHPFTFNLLKRVFEVYEELVIRHKNRETSIEEELLGV